MGSSEHNSAYISPPNRLILSKWAFFYHVLSEYANLSCNFTNLVFVTLSFLFSITVENSNASQQKNKKNDPTCIFPTHGEFSSDPASCISHLFHFFLTSVHVPFITVGNDGIALQVLRLCSEHLISGYITIFATQPSNSTALQVSKQKIRADELLLFWNNFKNIKYAGCPVA